MASSAMPPRHDGAVTAALLRFASAQGGTDARCVPPDVAYCPHAEGHVERERVGRGRCVVEAACQARVPMPRQGRNRRPRAPTMEANTATGPNCQTKTERCVLLEMVLRIVHASLGRPGNDRACRGLTHIGNHARSTRMRQFTALRGGSSARTFQIRTISDPQSLKDNPRDGLSSARRGSSRVCDRRSPERGDFAIASRRSSWSTRMQEGLR
jgi:hypothetical protein